MIAIIVKTYSRPEYLRRCVTSILSFADLPFRIYIGDDSPERDRPVELYESLQAEGHYVHLFDERVSVTFARNFLIDKLGSESYVLRIDDDFLFCEETSLSNLVKVLESSCAIGAVSSVERQLGDGKGVRDGQLSDKQGYFLRDGRVLYKLCLPVSSVNWIETSGGVKYATFDFARNFLLVKREVFGVVRWREELFIQGEHSAFMLDLKNAGYLLAETPDSLHCHDERFVKAAAYLKARKSGDGLSAMQEFYSKPYGIDAIRSLSFDAVVEAQNPSYGKIFKMFIKRVAKDVRAAWR